MERNGDLYACCRTINLGCSESIKLTNIGHAIDRSIQKLIMDTKYASWVWWKSDKVVYFSEEAAYWPISTYVGLPVVLSYGCWLGCQIDKFREIWVDGHLITVPCVYILLKSQQWLYSATLIATGCCPNANNYSEMQDHAIMMNSVSRSRDGSR
jgi:hypothetical protein